MPRRPAPLPAPISAAPVTDPALFEDGALTTNQAAVFLGESRNTIYILMRNGFIPWIQRGRHRRIPKRALVAYLSSFPLIGGTVQQI